MKNLLSENMLRFATKNLSESAKKELVVKSIMETIAQHGLQKEISNALVEQETPAADPNLGLAQKIVGIIWTAMSGPGTVDKTVYNAVMMIKNPAIYKSVVNIIRTSPKIKAEFGNNYQDVGAWLSTDMQGNISNSFTPGDFNDRIVTGINRHLSQFGDKGIASANLFGSTHGRTYKDKGSKSMGQNLGKF